jgi:thioredoxin-like negative regulator of GroEL
LLYRDAPAIGSIGSRPKAREHLQNAIKLAPESPDNRLNLIDTYLKWGETESAQKELKALEEMWPQARANLKGEQWESNWPDWEARLKKAKAKLTTSTPKP